ncbi:uncharacterized protein LOC124951322 [Vespa velutina]|uniref:uncharacterized protein LOC124951322 n=1 Tax=Vespa velutina TaxID=202808 RepID=UPI001FB1E1BF|nr:uncharacterized protein LOC124951322 [Vespa velutina]
MIIKYYNKNNYYRYRLSHLIDEKVLDDDVLNPSISKDKYYKDISLYALRHQKAIEFAELLDSFYSKTFFMISGLSMLRISVTGLKVYSQIFFFNNQLVISNYR